MGTTSVFIKTLTKRIGGNEGCWRGPKIEAEGQEPGGVLGEGAASPTS